MYIENQVSIKFQDFCTSNFKDGISFWDAFRISLPGVLFNTGTSQIWSLITNPLQAQHLSDSSSSPNGALEQGKSVIARTSCCLLYLEQGNPLSLIQESHVSAKFCETVASQLLACKQVKLGPSSFWTVHSFMR